MPTHMTSRLENALVFAAQLHREQWRKGSNVPYVSHLLAVSALVIEHGGDEDEAIAALLHDAIEDQGGPKTRDEILRRFGERVTGIVEGCTDSQTIPNPRGKKESWPTSQELATSRRRSNSSAPPTSSTMRAAFSAITGLWARKSGSASWVAGKGRFGITGRWCKHSSSQVGRRLWTNWSGSSAKSSGSRASNFAPLVWTGRIGENRGCSRGRRGARGDGPSRPCSVTRCGKLGV